MPAISMQPMLMFISMKLVSCAQALIGTNSWTKVKIVKNRFIRNIFCLSSLPGDLLDYGRRAIPFSHSLPKGQSTKIYFQ